MKRPEKKSYSLSGSFGYTQANFTYDKILKLLKDSD